MLQHTNKQRLVHRLPSYVTSLAAGLLLVACASGVEDHEQTKPLGGGAIGRIAAGANGADPDLGGAGDNGDEEDRRDDNSNDGRNNGSNSVSSVSRAPQDTGLADHDEDGVPDRYETKTGIVVDSSNVGTDPEKKDTDGDGISDGDELYGTSGGLDLPGMGANPNHRDILLEYDWIDDAFECAAHSHKPTESQLAKVTRAFAEAPIRNPDGKPGINLIHDFGQGGLFTGGSLITEPGQTIEGASTGAEFKGYQTSKMARNRVGYFHWVLMAHRYRTRKPGLKVAWDTDSSGNAVLGGYGLMVTLHCVVVPGWLRSEFKVDDLIANTIMHELGHNLGLQHGGNEEVNGKPNYNSVMNYAYQFSGAHADCAEKGPRKLDFSGAMLATLDENKLYEPAGVCNNSWWDWNGNKKEDQSLLAFDVNGDKKLSKLTGFDDWAKIASSGVLVSSKFVSDSEEDEVCPPPPGLESASEDGTDDGSDDGTDDGSEDGTDDGSDDGTDDGTDGTDDGTDDGSDDSSADGSEE